jgi:hypothetical protein
MTAPPHDGRSYQRLSWMLGAALFIPPLAVLANLEIAYALVPSACVARNTLLLHLVNAACFALAATGGLMAWRSLRAVEDGRPEEEGSLLARTRFIAGVAVLLSGLSVLVIVAQWIAVFILDPCQ